MRYEADMSNPEESPPSSSDLMAAAAQAQKNRTRVARCDATASKTDTVQWSELFAHNDDIWPASTTAIHASDVGGKVAVVWKAGQLGGLRIRVAAADLLARAEDVVVFDDRMHNGVLKPDSTSLETNMLSHGDTTMLFVRVVPGVFVFKVEASRALTPVKVEQ